MRRALVAWLVALACQVRFFSLCTAGTLPQSPLPEVNNLSVPLHVEGRWIVDATRKRLKLRCINWAEHLEINIPEGLHRQSVEWIAGWIRAQGFNCVLLTYSTDMARHPHVPVQDSFASAAKAAGIDKAPLMKLYLQAAEKNPFLTNDTRVITVLDVFDRVQAALWDQGVMTILDNHVSRAGWCCNLKDGNGFWKDAELSTPENSRFFNTTEWHEGLAAMAEWSRSRPGIVGLSLRNELRAGILQIPWAARIWEQFVSDAAKLVHGVNGDALIIVGGIDSATNWRSPLRGQKEPYLADMLDKRVWEAHSYKFTYTTPHFNICPLLKWELGLMSGFVLTPQKHYTGPLFVSEFGVDMTDGQKHGFSRTDRLFLSCLTDYMAHNDADWAIWALQGSYYVRERIIDHNETWGVLNYDWTGWRTSEVRGYLRPIMKTTMGTEDSATTWQQTEEPR